MGGLLFLCLIVAALGNGVSDAVQKELAAFEGRWKVQWIEQDGKKPEIDERLCIIRGAKCQWFKAGADAKGEEATLTIDPTCTPKIIDYTAPAVNGTKKEGIYKI